MSVKKTGDTGRGAAGRGFTGKEITGAGKPEPRGVQQIRRENTRLLQAEHLLPKRQQVGAEGIERSGGDVASVIGGVNCRKGIFLRKDVVEPDGSEILADG